MISKTLRNYFLLQSSFNSLIKTTHLLPTSFYAFGTTRQEKGFKKSPINPKRPSPKFDPRKKSRDFSDESITSKTPSLPKKFISKYKTEDIKERTPRLSKFKEDFEFDLPENEELSAIPFDVFTQQLATKTKEEVIYELNELESLHERQRSGISEGFKFGIPWNFENKFTKPEEGNLESSLGLERLMNFDVALNLFNNYVVALEKNNTTKLREMMEYTFAKKYSRYLEGMEEQGYKIKIEGNNLEETDIDLYKVTNYFCVGVNPNRKKNRRDNQYHIFDNLVNDYPVTNIIKKKPGAEDMAVIRVVVDLFIETPILMKIVDKEGNVIEEESKESQDEKNRKGHLMRIENDVLQIEYKTLKKNLPHGEILHEDSTKSFRMVFDHKNWKIIDFDEYMDGNEPIPY